MAEDGGSWELDDVEARFEGGVLRGSKSFVLDGHIADLILVAARDEGGVGLFAVEDVSRLTRTSVPTLDQTRKLARIEFDGVPARKVGGEDAIRRALDVAAVALAAEQLGARRRPWT